MKDKINEMLEENEVQVRIGTNWYVLDSLDFIDGKVPILVSDEDGGDHEFDLCDVDEILPEYEHSVTLQDFKNYGFA